MKDKENRNGFGAGLVLGMILLGLLIYKVCYGQDIKTTTIYPAKQGQVLILYPDARDCFAGNSHRILYAFGNQYQCDSDGRLIIGIDFQEKPGSYHIQGTDIYIDVADAKYARPVRRRKKPRELSEEKRLELKAKRDAELQRMSVGLWSGPSRYPNWPAQTLFRQPLDIEREVTDEFGITRMYWWDKPENARPSPHRGEDRKAPYETDAFAVGNCAVMLAELFMREGNMVALYCGSGIYFLYMHLQDMTVQKGQIVNKGDLIGHTGDTGAPGNPHLHFQVKILGAAVHPQEFIERFNASLAYRRDRWHK